MMVSEFCPNRLELQAVGGNKEETFIVVTVIVFLLALSHCWHSKQTACASRTEFFGNCFFFFVSLLAQMPAQGRARARTRVSMMVRDVESI